MEISEQISDRIDSLFLSSVDIKALKKAFKNLSDIYRSQKKASSISMKCLSEEERLVYLATRYPATSRVISRVLQELSYKIDSKKVCSVLDVGSGPGSSISGILERFENIREITLLENDPSWIAVSKKLFDFLKLEMSWNCIDFVDYAPKKAFDLVICSYSLGEAAPKLRKKTLENLAEKTKIAFVIIEPGTQVGYENIQEYRKTLHTLGFSTVAPCPHSKSCPMKPGDWCHFPQRVFRSKLHKEIKNATLGYEDEKYSYAVFTRDGETEKNALKNPRIIDAPKKSSGLIEFRVCRENEKIQEEKVSRKDKEKFKKAKKLTWGDILDLENKQ